MVKSAFGIDDTAYPVFSVYTRVGEQSGLDIFAVFRRLVFFVQRLPMRIIPRVLFHASIFLFAPDVCCSSETQTDTLEARVPESFPFF